MKRILMIGIMAIAMLSVAQAQNEVDAFRFSQIEWGGTARFVGAGSAFGAVGADFSALATNPASIGVFKKSEVSFTPVVISILNNTTSYNGNTVFNKRTRYSVSNVGLVFTMPKISEKWVGLQLGFGYNRIYDFNGMSRCTGMSSGSTMVENFLSGANGVNYNRLSGDALLAFNTWLIDTVPGTTNQYWSDFSGHDVAQTRYSITKGGIDEMTFSIGTNYNDKIYIGATLGVPFVDYEEVTTYEEEDVNEEVDAFSSYKMTDRLTVNGTGINFKIGILYQPISYVRFGVAVHTPTYYSNLKDNFARVMISYYDNGGNSQESPYENNFKYSLSTPFRVMGNVAFFINRRAFVSAEYEYANFGMANLNSDEYLFLEENTAIQNKYGSMHIARVGAEVNVTQHFMLRAGYNFKSSPYRDRANDGSAHIASAGFGVRGNHVFFDMAYQCKISKDKYWLYDSPFINAVDSKNAYHRIVATIGFKF